MVDVSPPEFGINQFDQRMHGVRNLRPDLAEQLDATDALVDALIDEGLDMHRVASIGGGLLDIWEQVPREQ